MDDMPEWVIPVIFLVIAIIIIVLVVNFLIAHPMIAGIIIGLSAGIAGTVVVYGVRRWFKTHSIEVKDKDKE